MSYDDIKDMLMKKIDQELYNYKQDLIRNYTPEQIVKNAYEIAVKEQIADEIKDRNLDKNEIKALLKSDNLLSKCYDNWMDEDTKLGTILESSIDETIEDITIEFEEMKKQNYKEGR